MVCKKGIFLLSLKLWRIKNLLLVFICMLMCKVKGTTTNRNCPVPTPYLEASDSDDREFSADYELQIPPTTSPTTINNNRTTWIHHTNYNGRTITREKDVRCEWLIGASDEDSFIVFTFKDLNLLYKRIYGEYDCFKLYDRQANQDSYLETVCGADVPDQDGYRSSDQYLLVIFIQAPIPGPRSFRFAYRSEDKPLTGAARLATIVIPVIVAVSVVFLAFKLTRCCRRCRKRWCPDCVDGDYDSSDIEEEGESSLRQELQTRTSTTTHDHLAVPADSSTRRHNSNHENFDAETGVPSSYSDRISNGDGFYNRFRNPSWSSQTRFEHETFRHPSSGSSFGVEHGRNEFDSSENDIEGVGYGSGVLDSQQNREENNQNEHQGSRPSSGRFLSPSAPQPPHDDLEMFPEGHGYLNPSSFPAMGETQAVDTSRPERFRHGSGNRMPAGIRPDSSAHRPPSYELVADQDLSSSARFDGGIRGQDSSLGEDRRHQSYRNSGSSQGVGEHADEERPPDELLPSYQSLFG